VEGEHCWASQQWHLCVPESENEAGASGKCGPREDPGTKLIAGVARLATATVGKLAACPTSSQHRVGFGGGGVEEEGADVVEVFGLAADVLADGLDVAEVAVEGGFATIDGGGAEDVVHELDGVAG